MILPRFFILIFVTIGFISNSFAVKSITITNSTNSDLLACEMWDATGKLNTVPSTAEGYGLPTKIDKNKSQGYVFDADKNLTFISCIGGTKSFGEPFQYYTVCRDNCPSTTVTYVVTQNHLEQ